MREVLLRGLDRAASVLDTIGNSKNKTGDATGVSG
jgi:hypothetical protein